MRPSLFALGGALALANAGPIVHTSYGKLEGTYSDYRSGIEVFKGIPFAQPPTGPLRWRAPKHPKRWHGIKSATSFGAECPQQLSSPSDQTENSSPLSSIANVTSEDCLYLNVWKPENATKGDKLPVYIWYYGGRFSSGSGAVLAYDGSGLASKDVIVVTMNYRTGPFGFYAHPDLAKEHGAHNSSGNYAVLDMIAALEWVHEEIEEFGGNPDQITTGGQSSGSSCSLDMMYSPLSRDLVAGTIAESGARAPNDALTASLATSYRNLTEAYDNGVATMAYFNVTTIEQMRNLSMDALLDVLNEDSTIFDGTQYADVSNFMGPPEWRPVLDGYVLPYIESEYGTALAKNNHGDVPVLTGNNADESGASPEPGYTLETYIGNMTDVMGNLSTRYFELYPANTTDQANNQSNNFWRDLSRVSTWQFAKQWNAGGSESKVYSYYWTHAPPDQENGAFHGSELYYVFNNIPYARAQANWTIDDYQIETSMSDYWVNFIKTGNPNGCNLTAFPASTANASQTMWLGNSFGASYLTDDDAKVALIEDWFAQQHEY